jgi:hypothetical protein
MQLRVTSSNVGAQVLLRAVFAAAMMLSSVFAADLKAPKQVTAGEGVTITAGDSGELLLFGPAGASKRKVSAGEVQIPGEDVRAAGEYVAAMGDASTNFYVVAAKPTTVNFLARPSRVPVSRPDAISGVAFVFDDFQNLVLKPTPVKFDLSVKENAPTSRSVEAKEGIAFTRLPSAAKEGAAQFVATVPGGTPVRRVVQQVASDACNLHMKAAEKTEKSIIVETDPIKDCSGNAVPDGTIVTFIELTDKGRSTVDARIKRGTARAELPLAGHGTISVASGVVTGNELQIGGGQ